MRKHATQARDIALEKAQVLVEALPWINLHSGQTIVVKYGGAAMEDEEYFQSCTAAVRENRQWTTEQLAALGFTVLPSAALT